jgi:hypothetical protein
MAASRVPSDWTTSERCGRQVGLNDRPGDPADVRQVGRGLSLLFGRRRPAAIEQCDGGEGEDGEDNGTGSFHGLI